MNKKFNGNGSHMPAVVIEEFDDDHFNNTPPKKK